MHTQVCVCVLECSGSSCKELTKTFRSKRMNGVFWWARCLPVSPGLPSVPLMPGAPSLPVSPTSPRDVRWKDGVNTTCIPLQCLDVKGA